MSKDKALKDMESETKIEIGTKILREGILTEQLAPGERLKQKELADQLGVSPTPVREILRRLEVEGLVEYRPRKGSFVSQATAEDVVENTPILCALERLAMKLAIPKVSEDCIARLSIYQDEFEQAWKKKDLFNVNRLDYLLHREIHIASGSDTLRSLINRIWPRHGHLLWMIPNRIEITNQQHRTILEYIRDGNVESAADAIEEHVKMSSEVVLEYLSMNVEKGGIKSLGLEMSD
jgi:DNA-binding GntR family transcriptional regulator